MHDKGQRFVDIFMLAMGILLGLAVGVLLLLNVTLLESRSHIAVDDPEVLAAMSERLAPVGSVLPLGDEALSATPPAQTPPPVQETLSGAQVYNQACNVCHAAPGIGGAPVFGDAAAWAPRIAQGMETLNQRAIEGFQGSTGVMPPKGGRVDLSDEEILSAVQFMVDEVGAE